MQKFTVLFLFFLGSRFASATTDLSAQFTFSETTDDAKVGNFVSSESGFSTLTYWIEGPTGLILIDTQFLLSMAEKAIATAEKHTGKKVVAAFVLHPNPDKFNGVEVFKKHNIRVITSKAIMKEIPAVHELRKSWFYDRFKPDYPVNAPVIETVENSPGKKDLKMTLAGTEVTLHFLGKGCSEAHLAIEWNKHLFVGDLVTNDYHSWLELGFVEEWIKRIQELQALQPSWVHPGRGPGGDYSLLDQQLHYLKTVDKITKTVTKKIKNPEKATEALESQIIAAFPGYRNEIFVSNGVEALVKNATKKK